MATSNVPVRGGITLAVGVEARRDQIIRIVRDRMALSESAHSGQRMKLPRLYDSWWGTWTSVYHPHKNNVHIPLINSALWNDAARKAATSLSQWPIVSFTGYDSTSLAQARKQEALISAQMKDDNLFQKQVDLILSADLYGVAVEQIGWKRKEEYRYLEALDETPLTKQTIKTVRQGKMVTFDGPSSENLDLLDCYPQPGVRLIRDMKWFIKRYYLDIDDLRALAAAGIFDRAEVDRLAREGATGPSRSQDPGVVRRFQSRLGLDDEAARWLDKYSTPIEIIEMWGVLPSELCTDKVLTRVISVANRSYLLRNRPLPFWHGQLPFLQFSPMPDPHYFWAAGKAEAIEKLQITGERFLNQSLDAAELIVDPVYFYNRESNLNMRNRVVRPGLFLPVDGNPNQVVAPLVSNLASLTMADQKVAQVREIAQMGTGITEDGIAGLAGDSRQTAREFIGRREAAGTRLALESRLYEECLLEPHANLMVACNKQFLEPPVEVSILGSTAMTDPVTGEPLQTSRVQLTHYDLLGNFQAKAVGASTTLSKISRQNSYVQLMQMMATPLGQSIVGRINAINLFRGIFRDFDVSNINEVFSQNPELGALVQGAGFSDVSQVPTSPELANNPLAALMGGEGAANGPAPPLPIPGMPGELGEQVPNVLPGT